MKVIFDLDGTIADISHRVHFVRDGNKDWDAFFAGCVDDRPNEAVVDTLHAHVTAGHHVEIWSARSDIVRRETEDWLRNAAHIPPRLLTRMRSAGDNTPDVVLKRYWLNQLHESKRPDLIYDDRQRVVDMWREEGIACFQVAANWEAPAVIAPTRDPLLTLLVGPSGAGKSMYAEARYPEHWVLSSDFLRHEYCGDFRDQSRNSDVFAALHRLAKARMDSGLPVVIDATNLRRRDRLAIVSLAPDCAGVEYVVIDRPLAEKMRDAGWRAGVKIGDKSLVETHHERFRSCLKDILKGDGLPQVRVVDERRYTNLKVAA
jgi:hypothetical protein